MSRSVFAMRRRTFLCVTLLVLVVAVALAFVSAQEDAVAADAIQQAEEHHHHHDHHDHHDHHEDASLAADAVTEEAPAAEEEVATAAPAAAEETAQAQDNAAAEAQAQAQAQQQQQREEEEARQRQQAEEEATRRQEEEERARQQAEEEARQRQEAEDAARREDEARIRREEEQRRRQEEEERARRQAEEEERARRQAEEEARQRREAEERQRREAEAEAARRAAAEKAKREVDSVDVIRYTAKEMPEGCPALVEMYLYRVHEERQRPAAAVSQARAALNEARVSASDKAAHLEEELVKAQDALRVYDVQTLRTYGGNVPKTCIAEAQTWYDRQPAVASENTYVQAYTHFYRLIAAHLYTMYRTGEGLVSYLMHAYTPSLHYFTSSASAYQNKAWALYEELFPAKGGRPDMPMADFAKQLATMAGYASVPICLGIAAGVVSVVALAPVAAGIILYEYLYKIWAELFIFYYIYGMKLPEDMVTVLKTSVANVKAGQWSELGTRYANAFFDSVIDSDKIFYNGILAIFLLTHVVVIVAIMVCVWCRLCVPGMRGRKPRKSPLNTKATKAPGNAKNASKEKTAQSAAPAKKKSSPSPPAADKKKK